jgi:hypothetical protein
MYEHRTSRLASRREFASRVAGHGLVVVSMVLTALGIGIVGYHHLAKLPWMDALLNASMILSGMGPVDPLRTPVAKVFASFYALFSGVVFIGVASVLIAPFAHRLLHRFNLEK